MARRWFAMIAAIALVAALFYFRDSPRVFSASLPPREAASAAANSTSARDIGLAAATAAAVDARATRSRDALFTFEHPAEAAALDAALPAPAHQVHYVKLNLPLIAGKASPFWQAAGSGRLTLPLPDGDALVIMIDNSEMLGSDRFTSRGRIEGRPQSQAVFAYHGGFLHASIDDAELGSFALRAATAELTQFYRVAPELVSPCGGEPRPKLDQQILAAIAARQSVLAETASGPNDPSIAAAEIPNHVEVHVMFAYSQAVLTTLSGTSRAAALQSAFDAAVAKVNAAFDASQITARVKLVKIQEVNYAPDGPSGTSVDSLQTNALTAIQDVDDGALDEIHALRDSAGADIVCLALNRSDPGSSGIGFLLGEPGDASNPFFAFSIVQYGLMAGTNVVAHEFGHNFGCAHDRANSTDAGAYPYSYGYRFFGQNGVQYRDIMAYPPGTQLAYFSNPAITAPSPVNAPIGVAAGQPGEADNARTIEQTAFNTATYRLQVQAAPNVGTLVNVSTRAFVGTGEQVLIGGFVITGSQSKTVLIRGAGPALIPFGVTNALSDPRLQIYSGQTKVFENDNWGTPIGGAASGAQIGTVAAQVGAFGFSAGSADAALLVSLQPGAYTAILEGVSSATGSGLVEAYEVDRTGNKIINLSTRGYADNQGKEMHGGFVVEGAVGTTKRILVRVQGPSLARPPFNITGALNDPFMELRGANGQILTANDDWSSGTTLGTPSPTNDFSPIVRFYGEQQIFATGLAPANRREPCVLVDLPPGQYTVIVKPFERRDPDPDFDQPAKPGVGIVEVYEINP